MSKLNLTDITLICVSSIKINQCLSSLGHCIEKCSFYDAKFITDKPINDTSNIKIQKCDPLNNLQEYSDFLLTNLHNYVDSKYCLLIQDHAFISNVDKWDDAFLNYDYIGAPWPLWLINRLMNNLQMGLDLHNRPFSDMLTLDNYDAQNYRVGNGGFSLRSKKLLNFTAQFEDKYPNKPEDNIICIYEKSNLINKGICIAPIDIAAKFSIEMPTEYNNTANRLATFGFHTV